MPAPATNETIPSAIDLISLFRQFTLERNLQITSTAGPLFIHRDNSYDFCRNYFSSFKDKKLLASAEYMEMSCLQLGFYLASWGMLRGSSPLLNRSVAFYAPIIELIAAADLRLWTIDIPDYADSAQIDLLMGFYADLAAWVPHKTKLTLSTKIMLGVFGNVPAFDQYFTKGMSSLTNRVCSFGSFSNKSLRAILEFYDRHENEIDQLAGELVTHGFGFQAAPGGLLYSRAKIVDILGFQQGANLSSMMEGNS